ncbi:MAG TPA: hypothetical protein VF992_01930 [Thermoplasmata archaeon]
MGKGDAEAVRDGYRVALRGALTSPDPAALVRLRGELQIVSRWLGVERRDDLRRTAASALDAVTDFYQFGLEIGGFSASTKAAESASFYDLASIGILATENVLTAERKSLMRFLMSGLAEGLTFLGSRQYVAGSEAVLQAAYRTRSLAVHDALWSLATEFRNPSDLPSIREARGAIDAVFAKIDGPGVPVGTRLGALLRLAALVAVIRCASLLDALDAFR